MAEDLNIVNDGTETITVPNSALDKLLGGIPKREANEIVETQEEKDEKAKAELEAETLRLANEKKAQEEKDALEGSGKTKEEEQQTEVDEDSIIGGFITKYGQVEGEFDDTVEGLMTYTDKIILKAQDEGKQEGVKQLFSELPLVQSFVEHLMAGYGPESFQKQFEAVDYSKIEVKEDNKELQEKLYRAALAAKGNSEDDINDLVETAKDGGKLFDKSKLAITALDTIEKGRIQKQKDIEKAQSDANKKEEEDTLKQIDTILKGGNIAGVSFTAEKIKELRSFGTVVGKDGLTDRDRKWNDLSLEKLLLLDSIVMDDFKGLGIKITPESTKSKSLKDLKKKAEDTQKVDLTTSGAKQDFKVNTRGLFQNNNN